MSEEVKKLFEETVENLKHLDKNGILLIKNGTELLKAKEVLDNSKDDKKAG